MHSLTGHSAQTTFVPRDSRSVSEETYSTYRSSSADNALIFRVSEKNMEDWEELRVAIAEFRRLVNEKKRGFDRLIQASGGENTGKNYVWARLQVQKDDPPCIHTLKKILQKHGIAVALFMGDWLVTRDGKAQAEACGTRRFADIQTYMTQWYHKHWLINDKKYAYRPSEHPDRPNGSGWKFVHLSNWCWSGDIMLENQSNTDTPLWKWKWTTTDFWTEVGLCDKIYFSLSALFRKCLKPGHNQEPILEFCDFLTTCINRDIQNHKKNKGALDPHLLEVDINYLKEYLLENASEYGMRINNGMYNSDGEFPDGKKLVRLSKDAIAMINMLARKPGEVLITYFREEFQNEKIDAIAPFLFHNIFVWDFWDFDTIFPGDEPRFHMITSVRWSSHIDNIAYKNLLRSSCKKLKPGGIIIDDGIRRSYTRECRWREMIELASELGEDYKFHFIKSSNWDILSVFIQRVAINSKWDKVHLTPQEIRENITGPEGWIAVPIQNYAKSDESEKIYLIRAEVRSAIMAALLWWHDRAESDWEKLLKLGPIQDAIDGAESAINQTALQHIPIWKGDTKFVINDYIGTISSQVMATLWNEVCNPKDVANSQKSLQALTNKHRQSRRGWRKPDIVEV